MFADPLSAALFIGLAGFKKLLNVIFRAAPHVVADLGIARHLLKNDEHSLKRVFHVLPPGDGG